MSEESVNKHETDENDRLALHRPIVFLDIQTTGPDRRTARVVRLSTLRVEPDGTESFRFQLINPLSPISPGATAFHGIADDDVADAKPFAAYAASLAQYLEGCDLAGFGIRRFHLKVLRREFEYAGIEFNIDGQAVVDAMEIYHQLEPRDFEAAYRRFVGGNVSRPLDAETSIKATRSIIAGQLRLNTELPRDPASLASWATREDDSNFIDDQGRFTLSDEGDPMINFGRYRGHTLYDMSELHPDYLQWIASDASFTERQRQIAADAAEGIMPDV